MMDIIALYDIFKKCGAVATDTRTLKGGELFFALKGENFDGNEYAMKALESGAAYAVVAADSAVAARATDAARIIPVGDTLKALQELARWHRSMTFVDGKPLTVIALTGTNGKTTTKELIREVLSVKYNVTATEGNLNNSIGVPLTLLRINDKTQIAVVEMGASHPGDIKELVDIALPNYGLVTNVGKAHLLGFGSFEGVMNTKGELYDYLRRTGDKVFLNADNPYLCRMASERNLHNDPERPYSLVIPYGLEYRKARVLEPSSEHPYLRVAVPADGSTEEIVIETGLVGAYNADNVMAAIAVGQHFGISLEEAAGAVSSYVPSNSRSQMVRTEKNVLIVDAYNANPTSMEAALGNFGIFSAARKAAMLGDMLELGSDSQAEHERIVRKAMEAGLDSLFLVGAEFGKALMELAGKHCAETVSCSADMSEYVCDGLRIFHFASSQELASWLAGNPLLGHAVLIKGSRGIRMEKVIEML